MIWIIDAICLCRCYFCLVSKMRFENRRACYHVFFVSLVGASVLITCIMMYQLDTWKFTTGLIPAENLMERYRIYNGDFQLVSNRNRTFVYSAYLEERASKIRVIGITENTTASTIYCVLWYMDHSNNVNSRLVNGYVIKITENHNKRYTAAYIICYLHGNQVPDAVSIVENITEVNPSNILPVHRPEVLEQKHGIAACLSPLQRGYGDTKELIEWLEMIQIQGVTYVNVYLHNATNDVISVLKYYQSIGVVKIFPWTLPKVFCNQTENKLHYCGQIVAINDCIYRNKGKSRYVTSFDLDEMITPQHHRDFTLLDMLHKLPEESVYLLRNSFFSTSNNQYTLNSNSSDMLRIETYHFKEDFVYGPRDRSKWIARTEHAVTMGIHQAWTISQGREFTVPTDIGLLHHYRKISKKLSDGINATKRLHTAADKYRKQLHSRVVRAHNTMHSMKYL